MRLAWLLLTAWVAALSPIAASVSSPPPPESLPSPPPLARQIGQNMFQQPPPPPRRTFAPGQAPFKVSTIAIVIVAASVNGAILGVSLRIIVLRYRRDTALLASRTSHPQHHPPARRVPLLRVTPTLVFQPDSKVAVGVKQLAPGSKEPHTSWTTDGSPFWSVDIQQVLQGAGPEPAAGAPADARLFTSGSAAPQQLASGGLMGAAQDGELRSAERGVAGSGDVLHPLQTVLSKREDSNV